MHATMEQTKQWMWSRRKLSESPFLGTQIHMISSASSYNESWEERAFAQDSAGHLRRYIWPPRSYSCSFCQREFRSAQALGGHMNVHRRDRARLRQWSSPAVDDDDNDQDHHNKTCTPLVGSLAYDSNSSKPNPSCGSLASPLFPRVSEAATRAFTEHALVSPSSYPSSVARESSRESHFTTSQSLAIPELNLVRENLKLREVGSVVSRDSNDEEIISIKRRRTDSVFPFFLRASSGCQQHDKFEVLNPSRNPVEEIDLELRLGGSPKVQQNSKDVRYG